MRGFNHVAAGHDRPACVAEIPLANVAYPSGGSAGSAAASVDFGLWLERGSRGVRGRRGSRQGWHLESFRNSSALSDAANNSHAWDDRGYCGRGVAASMQAGE